MAAVYLALGILLIVLTIYFAGTYGFKKITMDRRMTEDQCFNYLEKNMLYDRESYKKLPKEEVELRSAEGLKLRGVYIENFISTKKVMIIVHGYIASRFWSLQFVELFARLGYNILLVDQRSHGLSEGKYATYGYYEKYDLDLWVNWVRKRIGEDVVIGLHGQSMGGGTVLQYTAINKYVKFIIADCPYSDMGELMKHQFINLNHLPMFPLIHMVEHLLKRRAAFSIKDVRPIDAIKDKEIPIFFIHGSKDNFVPTHMSVDMFKAKKGYKKLLIIDDAVHANCYGVNRELYGKEVEDFLREIESLTV